MSRGAASDGGASRRWSAPAPARVLAAFSAGIYLEVRTELEPSVIAVVSGEAIRLPNALLLAAELPQRHGG